MFLEFTPATLSHSPEDEAAPARLTWPLYAGALALLAAGGGYETTLFVCDKLAQSQDAGIPETPLIRTVVRDQRTRESVKLPSVEPATLPLPGVTPVAVASEPTRGARRSALKPLPLMAAGASKARTRRALDVVTAAEASADSPVQENVDEQADVTPLSVEAYLNVPTQPAQNAAPAAEPVRPVVKALVVATPIKPQVQLVRVHGALTNRRALRGITRVEPQLTACLSGTSEADALRSASTFTWMLTSTIDPHGRARTTHVAAASGAAAGQLQACIERAAHQLQVDGPDTGGAVIEWSVTASH